MEKVKNLIDEKMNEQKILNTCKYSKDGYFKLAFIDKTKKDEAKVFFNNLINCIKNNFNIEECLKTRSIKIDNSIYKTFLNFANLLTSTKNDIFYDDKKIKTKVKNIIDIKQAMADSLLDMVKNNKNYLLGASWFSICKQFLKLYNYLYNKQVEDDELRRATIKLSKQKNNNKNK